MKVYVVELMKQQHQIWLADAIWKLQVIHV